MKEIKFIEDLLLQSITAKNYLTIVMNGVINKQYGDEIDNSESVFRFNLFKTSKALNPIVGKKTSFWFVNGNQSIAKHRKQIALCPFPANKYDKKQRNAFSALCPILYTNTDYRQFKDSEIEFPTTGYTAVLMLLKLFKLPLHIYGMDGLTSGHYWNTNHTHAKKHSGNLEVEHLKSEYSELIIWK